MAQSLSERFFDPLVNNDAVAGPVLLVARILMSGAFLVFGIGKIILRETWPGLIFLAVAAFAGGIIYWDLSRRGWSTVLE